jgi:hypothetical protein
LGGTGSLGRYPEAAITGVKIIGWIHLALGLLGMAAGLALCVGLGTSDDPRAPNTLAFVGPLILIATVVYLLPTVAGAVGLLLGRTWGRVAIAVTSLMLLTFFPIGTAIGAVSLWVLFGRKTTAAQLAPAPGEAPVPSPPAYRPPSAVLGLLLAMAGVGAGFVVAIGAGFRLNHQAAPAVIGAGFFPALLVLAAAIAMGVIGWRRAPPNADGSPGSPGLTAQQREKLRQEREAFFAEHRRRLAELAADPVRRKYVALIERGESWNDAQIAYDLDPAARVTCAHLRPIEAAMREAGLRVQPSVAAYANAEAVIDQAELSRLYPDPQVAYSEFELGGRHYEDNPMAQIACAEHRSAIYVLHPREAKADSPSFPADRA